MSMRWIILIIVALYSVYSDRTHLLNEFLRAEKSANFLRIFAALEFLQQEQTKK